MSRCTKCCEKHKKWLEVQSKWAEVGNGELDHFREELSKGNGTIKFHSHELAREFHRALSAHSVKEVLNDGWVIERTKITKFLDNEEQEIVNLRILYSVKIGVGKYRPLHLIINFNEDQPNKWLAITIYDPRSKAWMWNENYQERVCFCKKG